MRVADASKERSTRSAIVRADCPRVRAMQNYLPRDDGALRE
jgi:hypothetical protein